VLKKTAHKFSNTGSHDYVKKTKRKPMQFRYWITKADARLRHKIMSTNQRVCYVTNSVSSSWS